MFHATMTVLLISFPVAWKITAVLQWPCCWSV